MRKVVLAALLLTGFCVDMVLAKDTTRESVVKIYATQRPPDFIRPWTKAGARKTSGTGIVIEGNRVLTNWHVVEYASQLFVQLDQSTDRLPAEIVVAAPGLDMAILRLESAEALTDVPPLGIQPSLPTVRATVNVYGYPVGGDDLSVTEGIVSRIEFASYGLDASGLRIQVDAALNPGNSGGPAVIDGKVVGLVFSKMNQAENIGYLIPAEEINSFLLDGADGTYEGKPTLFDKIQTTENAALRDKLGLPADGGGVMVREANPAVGYPVQADDVITHIADQEIDNRGNVRISDDLRLDFRYLVPQHAEDGHIPLTLFRNGKSVQMKVPVKTRRELLMPMLHGKYPRYFIFGPMVFTVATQDFLSALGVKGYVYLSTINSPLMERRLDEPAFEGEEVVVLANRMLPHRMIKGYSNTPFGTIASVNGQAVENLRQVAELLRDFEDEFLTFEFHGENEKIVFRRKAMIEATEDILADEGIRYHASSDLRDINHGGP